MARKNTSAYFTENDVFPTKLRELIKETGTSQETLANYIGVTRQSVGYYAQGQSSPDWKGLVKIAEFFKVSLDYLLTDYPVESGDMTIRTLCKYTGIGEKAAVNIRAIVTASDAATDRLFDAEEKGCDSIGFKEALSGEYYASVAMNDIIGSDAFTEYCRVCAVCNMEAESVRRFLRGLTDDFASQEDIIAAANKMRANLRSVRSLEFEASEQSQKIYEEVLHLDELEQLCKDARDKLLSKITED